MLQESTLLTKREIEVINKRLAHKKLSQQDSNYLSRFVRPKLREMMQIDSRLLLSRLEYNQKIKSIENKIKSLILQNIKDVSSITLYGSIIYSNYRNYRDIDVLVSVTKKSWEKPGEKYRLITKIKKQARKKGMNLDIKIFTDREIYSSYPSNITLIYELKDSKTIYGRLLYPRKVAIDNSVLRFHLDYSYFVLEDIKENSLNEITGRELYSAIRNLWLIRLVLNRCIDNKSLIDVLNSELGENTITSLKDNTASVAQKRIAFIYLEDIYKRTERLIANMEGRLVWEERI
jgi:predicted nucleotidyltransferase